MLIEQMRAKIQAGQFELSKHAVDQSILRRISIQELREAIARGEIIEDYPEDKYGSELPGVGLYKSRQAVAYSLQLSLSAVGQDHHGI